MMKVNAKYLLLTAVVLGLVSVPSLGAEKKSWKDDTMLVSKQGDQTVVRKMKGDKVLFKHKDAQLAVEWAMANARTTLVQAGKYVVNDSIDVPRDGVTLIIDQGAVIEMNLDADPLSFQNHSVRQIGHLPAR
jgi:pectin methylesterase-like acyl-CoA thioesterase